MKLVEKQHERKCSCGEIYVDDNRLHVSMGVTQKITPTLSNETHKLGIHESNQIIMQTPIIYDMYEGDLIVKPKDYEQQLETKNKIVPDNVTVLEIPFIETSNESGTTVYIGD